MIKVFISGPIQGMEHNQEYRARIRRLLESRGYEVIDPWEREKVFYRASREDWWKNVPPREFIERDLRDVERCDALIAYLPRLSAGTCMELFYAKLKGKKVVSIIEFDNPSPWITLHSDVILRSLDELEMYVERRGLEELLSERTRC
ncbi:MAG: nucleoside 2-deoxyribosyltransferase [Nitrososphaerota archaeon]|nr:nucleoside 2-deoxyribosyltransferase [Candidatus Nezhaarchaeota archaeon]MDW8049552.1 nucleoside 2-deoxyribosyltransferase [Nitrososphaerota archaeon]